MVFKDRILKLRKEANLTRAKLAAKLGKSEGAIRAWEEGRNKAEADVLLQLAEIFDCSVDYLLGHSDVKNHQSRIEKEERDERRRKRLESISTEESHEVLLVSKRNPLDLLDEFINDPNLLTWLNQLDGYIETDADNYGYTFSGGRELTEDEIREMHRLESIIHIYKIYDNLRAKRMEAKRNKDS